METTIFRLLAVACWAFAIFLLWASWETLFPSGRPHYGAILRVPVGLLILWVAGKSVEAGLDFWRGVKR